MDIHAKIQAPLVLMGGIMGKGRAGVDPTLPILGIS